MGLQIIEQIYQGLKKLTGDDSNSEESRGERRNGEEQNTEQWWACVGRSAAPKPMAHHAPH